MSIVTLTTDFGTRDGYVGAMKGVVLSWAADVQLIDITHDIPRHDVAAGAYALATAVPLFPRGSIHVVVVDPGVGGTRQEVIYSVGGHLIVAPDNGLHELLALGPMRAWAIQREEFRRSRVSATFHGRDIFAAAAGALASGLPANSCGPEITLEGSLGTPEDGASIVHIDVFGNLISNLRCEPASDSPALVSVLGVEISLAETYGDVDVGELTAYCGSAGTVEIAVREGSAAELLGAELGVGISLRSLD